MYVVRNVFKCKPGKAMATAEKFKAAHALMSDLDFQTRIMVDEVGDFWTLVVEVSVEDLAVFGQGMHERGAREDVRQALEGYMDLVDGGYREIFRVVE